MVESGKGVRLSESLVQSPDGVAAHAFHKVRVGVHRLRDRRVTKKRLHDLRVLAPREERRREGVTQRVEVETLDSSHTKSLRTGRPIRLDVRIKSYIEGTGRRGKDATMAREQKNAALENEGR